jgi:hypothetical protein
MKQLRPFLLLAGAAVAAVALGPVQIAQIERLTLDQMVAKTDDSVLAEITAKRVFRVDHPIDGPELYFTTLTLQGESLETGQPLTVDVTFPGGFLDEENGVHNSEAPSDDDTRVGNVVVAFYAWSDDMGGDVAANALYASHGGLFRTVAGPTGTVVLGRGEGYAVAANKSVGALTDSIRAIVSEEKRK